MAVEIAILNRSTAITDDGVGHLVPALQAQLDHDFTPAWGIEAVLSFVPTSQTAGWQGKWNVVLLDHSDLAHALGYHDLTPDGLPLGKVFVADDLRSGALPSVTLSHELLEMLGDPHINLMVQDTTQATPTLYAFENCDAVESDRLAYAIDGVQVSDFVLPRYFDPGPGPGPFDFKGHLSAAFSVSAGGYMSRFDIAAGTWTQVRAAEDGKPSSGGVDPTRPGGGTRKERRGKPRAEWRRSAT
jgi:hypothetical protein